MLLWPSAKSQKRVVKFSWSARIFLYPSSPKKSKSNWKIGNFGIKENKCLTFLVLWKRSHREWLAPFVNGEKNSYAEILAFLNFSSCTINNRAMECRLLKKWRLLMLGFGAKDFVPLVLLSNKLHPMHSVWKLPKKVSSSRANFHFQRKPWVTIFCPL